MDSKGNFTIKKNPIKNAQLCGCFQKGTIIFGNIHVSVTSKLFLCPTVHTLLLSWMSNKPGILHFLVGETHQFQAI